MTFNEDLFDISIVFSLEKYTPLGRGHLFQLGMPAITIALFTVNR